MITLGLLVAFGITWVTIPSIVSVSRLKNLCVCPNGRTSHHMATPTLGGIAIFAGLVLSTVLVAREHSITELRFIFAGLIIIFFMGIKDDILIIDPLKKLAGQILAALILIVFADIRITNLYGLFHIGQLPYVASMILTVFVFIVIINGFNLIDGIDGLASGTGILTSAVFGLWFWLNGDIAYSILSFAFIGSLTAFFIYNVFGKKNKIFLGDTGSMLTGYILGILSCHFLQNKLASSAASHIPAAPVMVIGILIIPLFDSLRVFILRIARGNSPFKADKQHLHHRLLQLGFSHLKSTLILLSVNVFFILFSYFLRDIGMFRLVFLMAVIATVLSQILLNLARKQIKKLNEVDLLLAEYLKKLYRRKDGMIRRAEKIDVSRPRHVALNPN